MFSSLPSLPLVLFESSYLVFLIVEMETISTVDTILSLWTYLQHFLLEISFGVSL
jgi:hypothetical protein